MIPEEILKGSFRCKYIQFREVPEPPTRRKKLEILLIMIILVILTLIMTLMSQLVE